MIITKEDFTDMGFEYASEQETKLDGCIKRAEYILNAICRGTLYSASRNESSSELIKQAVAFQADALMKEAESRETSENISERVSLGDLSYSSGTKTEAKTAAPDVSDTVRKLLKAAGCFYGNGIAEVLK